MSRDELFHPGSKCWSRDTDLPPALPHDLPFTPALAWGLIFQLNISWKHSCYLNPNKARGSLLCEFRHKQVESRCCGKSGDSNFLHCLQKGCLPTFSTAQLVLGRDYVFKHLLYKSEMLALFSMGKGKELMCVERQFNVFLAFSLLQETSGISPFCIDGYWRFGWKENPDLKNFCSMFWLSEKQEQTGAGGWIAENVGHDDRDRTEYKVLWS